MPEQDPLAQLRGLHLPDAINAWPPAPGWWILATIIIALLCGAIYLLNRWLQQNRYRRQAVTQLELLADSPLDKPREYLQQLNQLLKQTAITAYPNDDVAGLTGKAWLLFLDSRVNSQGFSQGPGQALAAGPYATEIPELQRPALQALAQQWIKQHRKARAH